MNELIAKIKELEAAFLKDAEGVSKITIESK